MNWTSRLRTRAGFTSCRDGPSDFEYRDNDGALTRQFREMQHPYTSPEWLNTILDDGSAPLYRLEVKSTSTQDATTALFMSPLQHSLVIPCIKVRDRCTNAHSRR
jgi:hypothetical protein